MLAFRASAFNRRAGKNCARAVIVHGRDDALPSTPVKGDVRTTVLFADLAGGTRLSACADALQQAARDAGGEVVKRIGEGLMAAFPTPDAAAGAATQMHGAVAALLASSGETAAALRIGFHAGPVIRRDGDVFGDTVNLAARLAQHAARGQILTSRETARLLSPALRNAARALYSVEVRGRSGEVELWEVLWQQSPDITDLAGHKAAPAARLRLKRAGAEIDAPAEGLDIGRDPSCKLVIDDEHASRRHCSIRQRHGKFVVQDHSANGTYVTLEGEGEIALHREDYVLRGHGWISFGQPRGKAGEALEFFCE
jgi:adenylate cyclase